MSTLAEDMKPTPASEWLQPYVEGVILSLPSGNRVKLRPINLDYLMLQGKIPDLLTPLVSKTLWEGELDIDGIAEQNFKMARDLNELLSIIVPSAMMEPKIYLGDGDLPEGSITLEHLPMTDKLAIFQIATQPANNLVHFRNQQIGNVAPLSTGEDIEETTEQDN